MVLRRKIYDELAKWADAQYSLIVLGARQVGKSFIITDFLSKRFPNHVAFTLHNNIPLIRSLVHAVDDADFLLRLSAFTKSPITAETVVFIDEVQEYYTYLKKHPEIEVFYDLLGAAKSFGATKTNRFVFSGSLLRMEIENLPTLSPEGYLLPLTMYPLDFEEFLWARGIKQEHIDVVKDCFEKRTAVPDYLHDIMSREFSLYLLIGGMPNAVASFIETNSFARVDQAHRMIDAFIRDDISKYAADEDKIKIRSIYELLPHELDSPTKRFVLSNIEGHRKSEPEYLNFGWLCSAGIAIQALALGEPCVPLKSKSSLNKVKLFHEDVGLLSYLLMSPSIKESVLSGDTSVNFGSIYENAVAELLHAHGFDSLFFYFKKGVGEVDFVLEMGDGVALIEVKSGKDYKRHVALDNLVSVPNYRFSHVFVFHNGNYERIGGKEYLPVYWAEFLQTRRFDFFA